MPGGSNTGPVVLFSAGTGRSGCTVITSALGQVPGFCNVGEARYVWQKGLVDNRLCGCGERFRDCPFWGRVGEVAFGGWDAIDPEEIERLRRRVDDPRRFPALMLPRALRGKRFDADAERFAGILRSLYAGIVEASGAPVIVDSSRFATYALLLKRAGADVRMVHVMRDSRGVAFSWQKKVAVTDSPDKAIYLPTYSVSSGSLRWAAYNVQAWMTRFAGMPYMFVRYEDAMAEPALHLERMLAHAGSELGAGAVPLDGRRVALAEPMHTVMGHPVRLERGSLKLRVDDEWRVAMTPKARRTVTAITLPLLLSSGYAIRRSRVPADVLPLPAGSGARVANGASNGHPANGHPSNGHASNGVSTNGHLSNGHPSNGHLSNGHASNGVSTTGHSSNGHPSNGHPSIGHPSNGHPSNGHPSNGHPSNGQGKRAASPDPHAVDDSTHPRPSENGG